MLFKLVGLFLVFFTVAGLVSTFLVSFLEALGTTTATSDLVSEVGFS